MPRLSLPKMLLVVLSLLPPLLTLLVLWVIPAEPGNYDRYARAMRGFTNLWVAGATAASGSAMSLLNQPAHAATVRALFGAGFTEQLWGYPPSMLLIAVPFSLIPLSIGFTIWTAASVAALWQAMRWAGLGATATLAALCPSAVEGLLNGQNGGFAAALLVVALAGLGRRPVIAGIALGMLTLKPQLGVLLPICLIASRDRKASVVAVATAGILLVASSVAFGMEAWSGFFIQTRPFMTAILEHEWTGAAAQINFASPFMAARALSASIGVAYAVQGAVGLGCAAAVWLAWRRKDADPAMRIALTASLTLLATPYSHSYDLVALGVAVALIITGSKKKFTLAERIGLAIAWVWPGAMVMAAAFNSPAAASASLASLGMAAAAACAWRRLGKAEQPGEVRAESNDRDNISFQGITQAL